MVTAGLRFDNFSKVVKSEVSEDLTTFRKFLLVPTRQRGNAVSNAPALRERDAGAWEREKIYQIFKVKLESAVITAWLR